MCVLQRTPFFLKDGGRFVTLHLLFFKYHFLIFVTTAHAPVVTFAIEFVFRKSVTIEYT